VQLYEREEKKSLGLGVWEHLMRSQLARASGETAEAIDHARRGVRKADLIDWGETRYALNVELIRVALAAGRTVLARVTLGRLGALRHSQNGHWRYEFWLLLGDYHLAAARAALNLSPVDDEFDGRFPLNRASRVTRPPGWRAAGSEAARVAVRTALRKACRAYRAALKVGAWIDAQLECAWRTAQIEGRLARAAEIERAASPAAMAWAQAAD
jgi:hypothetical protein